MNEEVVIHVEKRFEQSLNLAKRSPVNRHQKNHTSRSPGSLAIRNSLESSGGISTDRTQVLNRNIVQFPCFSRTGDVSNHISAGLHLCSFNGRYGIFRLYVTEVNRFYSNGWRIRSGLHTSEKRRLHSSLGHTASRVSPKVKALMKRVILN